MADASAGLGFAHAVALLAAGVLAAPIFMRLGLGSVLGYLAAGVVIGPFGFRVINDPDAILQRRRTRRRHVSVSHRTRNAAGEAVVVAARHFRLGAAHVIVCAALLTGVGMLYGLALGSGADRRAWALCCRRPR